jgi:hypothetical protein
MNPHMPSSLLEEEKDGGDGGLTNKKRQVGKIASLNLTI